MIELHLIGYTADLEHLVLDLDGVDGDGRYRLVIDADLFATLDEIREQRLEVGMEAGQFVWVFEDEGEDEPAEDELREDAPTPRSRPVEEPRAAPDLAPLEGTRPYDDAPLIEDDGWETWIPEPLDEDTLDEIDPGSDAVAGDDTGGDDGDDLGWSDESMDEAAVAALLRPEAPVTEPMTRTLAELGLTADATGADESDAEASEDAWSVDDDLVTDDEPAPPADPAPATAEVEPEPALVDVEPEPPAPAPRRGRGVSLPSAEIAPSGAQLSPAEIQAELRKGRSVASVAKAAGTDRAWIERWLAPIEAERRRILERAWRAVLERPRLGASREPLRGAVERSLRARGVQPGDVSWEAARRANGTWKVSVKFVQRGRNRTATWTYDREDDRITAASELARDLGFTRPRSSAKKRSSGGGSRNGTAAKRASSRGSGAKGQGRSR